MSATKSRLAPFTIEDGRAKTSHMVVGGSAADAARAFAREEQKALKAGKTVVHADGRRVWRTRRPVSDAAQTGSDRYEWHADGNRIRCELREVTLSPDGEQVVRVLRRVWMDFDEI